MSAARPNNPAKVLPKPPKQSERATVAFLLLVAIGLVVAGYFYLSTRPFIIKSKFGNAYGLKAGAEVQLAGVKVGNVEQLRFLAVPTSDPNQAVFEIILSLNPVINGKPAGELIRKDAVAVLISTGALDDRSINIEPGSASEPPTKTGDYIASRIEPTISMLVDNSAIARNNFYRVREIMEENLKFINEGRGNYGKLNVPNNELELQLKELIKSTDELQLVLNHKSRGTLQRFQNDKKLKESLDRLTNLSEKLRTDLEKGRGALGRFINDQQLRARVEKLQVRANEISARFNKIMERAEKGEGAIVKFRGKKFNDDLQEAQNRFNRISMMLDQRQGSAGLFLYDKRLNENVSAISTETMKILYDLRQKPTKYIKFTLF